MTGNEALGVHGHPVCVPCRDTVFEDLAYHLLCWQVVLVILVSIDNHLILALLAEVGISVYARSIVLNLHRSCCMFAVRSLPRSVVALIEVGMHMHMIG